jgi:hypothetical protein
MASSILAQGGIGEICHESCLVFNFFFKGIRVLTAVGIVDKALTSLQQAGTTTVKVVGAVWTLSG